MSHLPNGEDRSETAIQPVHWVAVATSFYKGPAQVGHCCFASGSVEPLEPDILYAGIRNKVEDSVWNNSTKLHKQHR
jgi:hypothetical protein